MGFDVVLAIVGSIFSDSANDAAANKSTVRRRPFKDHPTRRQILELITDRPGRSISDLCRAIGAGWGTVQHHLYLLGQAGMIRGVMQGRNHRFFHGKEGVKRLEDVALLLRGRVRQLAIAVLEEPGIGQRKLTESISMSRKVLREYVNLLLQQGLLREESRSKFRYYFPTEALEELLAGSDVRPLPTSASDVPSSAPTNVSPSSNFVPTLHAQPLPGAPAVRPGKVQEGQL